MDLRISFDTILDFILKPIGIEVVQQISCTQRVKTGNEGLLNTPLHKCLLEQTSLLECGFRSNSTSKANSWDEGCPSLIYCILALFLDNVRLEFFPIHPFHAQHFWAWCVDNMMGGSFNGSRISFDIILEWELESNSTPKASS